MKKSSLCFVLGFIMIIVECTFIVYFGNHPEKSLPHWIPFYLAWGFYLTWIITSISLIIVGIILKIKEK